MILDADWPAEAEQVVRVEQGDRAGVAESGHEAGVVLAPAFGQRAGRGDQLALFVDEDDPAIDASFAQTFLVDQVLEAIFDGLGVNPQAVFDGHAEVVAGEVVGYGVGCGQIGERVVALGKVGGQRVGLLGEFEAGRIQQVLLKALLDVQVVREQNDRVGNEDQDRNEALAVAPQER